MDATEAYEIVKLLKPKVTIPMHYKTPYLKFGLDDVNSFLSKAGVSGNAEVLLRKNEIEITKDNIHQFPSIIVFDYK